MKADRNNYLALVIYGAAVQETDQKDEALKAFKKAIELSPDQLLAWRGLGCYYEKFENTCEPKELLTVYEKLIVLENDFIKFSDTIEKLQKLAISVKDFSSIKLMSNFVESTDEKRKTLIHQYIVSALELNLQENFFSEVSEFDSSCQMKLQYIFNQ